MEISIGKLVALCFILGILFKTYLYVYYPFEFIQDNDLSEIEKIGSLVRSINNSLITCSFDISR